MWKTQSCDGREDILDLQKPSFGLKHTEIILDPKLEYDTKAFCVSGFSETLNKRIFVKVIHKSLGQNETPELDVYKKLANDPITKDMVPRLYAIYRHVHYKTPCFAFLKYKRKPFLRTCRGQVDIIVCEFVEQGHLWRNDALIALRCAIGDDLYTHEFLGATLLLLDTLKKAQDAYKFMHNDLHCENVLVRFLGPGESVTRVVNGREIKQTRFVFLMWDFEFSCTTDIPNFKRPLTNDEKASPTDNINMYQEYSDLYFLCTSLLSNKTTVPASILTLILRLYTPEYLGESEYYDPDDPDEEYPPLISNIYSSGERNLDPHALTNTSGQLTNYAIRHAVKGCIPDTKEFLDLFKTKTS